MNKIMEIIYWIQIFISPVLVSAIIAAIIYFNNTNAYLLAIGVIVLGVILGVFFAERIRRKYGTSAYMGSIMGFSESKDDNLKDKNSN